jgi:hypothetical protein
MYKIKRLSILSSQLSVRSRLFVASGSPPGEPDFKNLDKWVWVCRKSDPGKAQAT